MTRKKRVLFCTYPSLYSSIVLKELLDAPGVEVVTVIASTRNLKAKENKLASDFKRIKLSGIQYASYLLLVTQAYKLSPSLSKLGNIHSTCRANHIPLISTADINTKDSKDKIKAINPEIIFCAHFNQLVQPRIYQLAQESAVNLHPSLLPDLKGVDPAFYALAKNYNKTGVTIHHLAEEFDTGEICAQKHCKITSDDTLISLNIKLFSIGAQLFIEGLSSSLNFTMEEFNRPINSYDSWPTKPIVKQFKKHRRFGFSFSLFI